MPEVGQYNFTMREAAIVLLKQAGITEGKWSFGVNFGINIGNFGPDESQAAPSFMAQVQGFNLTKAPNEVPESATVIDASKV